MASYLQKVAQIRKIVNHNGGLVGTFLKFFRQEEVRAGTLKGQDQFGNKYYEDKSFLVGRSRYVDFAPKYGWDYDASQIPPEWHRWMQYITDATPIEKPPKRYSWMQEHEENPTASPKEYVPYSTTKPKIESWKPPSAPAS